MEKPKELPKNRPISVGDIVVSRTMPNCVQRVTAVNPSPELHNNGNFVSCKTIWRLDGKPLSKNTNIAAEWSFRRASKQEIQDAIIRLQAIANQIK
jgi:hypothetical protein